MLADFLPQEPVVDDYWHVPLWEVSSPVRGQRLEELVMHIDQLRNPHSLVRQGTSTCKLGCDWMRDDQRVECKSAKMVRHQNRARFSFMNVMLPSRDGSLAKGFDLHLLALCSPWGVHVVEHDGAYGRTTIGALTDTCGDRVVLRSAERLTC